MGASTETTAHRHGFRLRPPAVVVPTDLEWLIARACGPPDRPLPDVAPTVRSSLDPDSCGADFAGRIWARTTTNVLTAELNSDLVEDCEARFHAAVALSLRHQEVARRIAELAAGLDAEVLVLKGLALQLGGYSRPGARMAADVDLLLAAESVVEVYHALLNEGSEDLDLPSEPHHLPPLLHPLGSTVELHQQLRGVSVPPGGTATLPDCLENGLCEPVSEFPDGTYIANRDLLTAHLLVHGLGQHGTAPESYPMLQLLGDLQDLGVGMGGFSPSRDNQIMGWIGALVSTEEVAAVEDLLERLESGELPSGIVEGSRDSSVLLRHMIAGQLSEDYRQSLKLGRQFESSSGGDFFRQAVRSTSRALWLTDGQIDMIYGAPESRLGYLGWRLWRPFDLVGRSVKSAWAWMKVRRRRAGK